MILGQIKTDGYKKPTIKERANGVVFNATKNFYQYLENTPLNQYREF